MMDTILNLGLNDTTVAALAAQSRQRAVRVGLLSPVRRDVRRGRARRRAPRPSTTSRRSTRSSTSIKAQAPREPRPGPHRGRAARGGRRVQGRGPATRPARRSPTTSRAQLWGAIGAVFRSWNNPRADVYRKMHGIPATMGTAVNVQAMVFGNLGDDCATGVAFTRNPATGTAELYGEFLDERAGRGRRRRHPHARADCRAREEAARRRTPSSCASRSSSRITSATCRTSSSRSRTASCSCCRRATASAPARRW